MRPATFGWPPPRGCSSCATNVCTWSKNLPLRHSRCWPTTPTSGLASRAECAGCPAAAGRTCPCQPAWIRRSGGWSTRKGACGRPRGWACSRWRKVDGRFSILRRHCRARRWRCSSPTATATSGPAVTAASSGSASGSWWSRSRPMIRAPWRDCARPTKTAKETCGWAASGTAWSAFPTAGPAATARPKDSTIPSSGRSHPIPTAGARGSAATTASVSWKTVASSCSFPAAPYPIPRVTTCWPRKTACGSAHDTGWCSSTNVAHAPGRFSNRPGLRPWRTRRSTASSVKMTAGSGSPPPAGFSRKSTAGSWRMASRKAWPTRACGSSCVVPTAPSMQAPRAGCSACVAAGSSNGAGTRGCRLARTSHRFSSAPMAR